MTRENRRPEKNKRVAYRTKINGRINTKKDITTHNSYAITGISILNEQENSYFFGC